MELVQEKFETLTPKSQIVVSSLAFVALTAITLRLWLKRWISEPPLLAQGRVRLGATDFGDAAETRRDASRAFAAGAILVQRPGEIAEPMPKPEGIVAGVDSAAVKQNVELFERELRSRLAGVELSAAAFERLLPSKHYMRVHRGGEGEGERGQLTARARRR